MWSGMVNIVGLAVLAKGLSTVAICVCAKPKAKELGLLLRTERLL